VADIEGSVVFYTRVLGLEEQVFVATSVLAFLA